MRSIAFFPLALALCAPFLAAAECTGDLSWCSVNIPRTAADKEHPNCVGAARDCPCTCREAYAAYKAEKAAKKAKLEARKNAAAEMVRKVNDAMAADAPSAAASALNIKYVVRSQPTPIDERHCAALADSLAAQGVDVARDVSFLHELSLEERKAGYWNLIPLMERFAASLADPEGTGAPGPPYVRHDFLVFLEPHTAVDAAGLRRTLSVVGAPAELLFVGHALQDKTGTIIHHQSHQMGLLKFPLLHAGFAMSAGLVAKLGASLAAKAISNMFHTEVAFELSALVKERADTQLVHVPSFCSYGGPAEGLASCGTTAGDKFEGAPNFGISPEDVVIGVKTYGAAHATRVKFIAETWGKDSSGVEIVYLSDEAGETAGGAPIVDLTQEWGAQVNQKKGHCAKCLAIMKQFDRHHGDKKWFVIADDDTTFSVPRLFRMLANYDHSKEIYLGERYGFSHRSSLTPNAAKAGTVHSHSNDYITMGGGVAFTRPLLKHLVHDCPFCTCSRDDEPDDMRFGNWVHSGLKLATTHDDRFHQAELFQYHEEVLKAQMQPIATKERHLVSFHKFKMKHAAAGGFEIDFDHMHGLYKDHMLDTELAERIAFEAAERKKKDEL
jgi:hypothetical protein